jgi:hypothetical protein
VQIHAWCLLGNHFHLMLLSESGRLSDAMRFLGSRFTQRINYRDGRDGPIFRGRFTSVAIESDAHLVRASRYIHRNPVEAGLATEPWQWPWSSAPAYVGLVRTPAWLHTEAILEMFGHDAAEVSGVSRRGDRCRDADELRGLVGCALGWMGSDPAGLTPCRALV